MHMAKARRKLVSSWALMVLMLWMCLVRGSCRSSWLLLQMILDSSWFTFTGAEGCFSLLACFAGAPVLIHSQWSRIWVVLPRPHLRGCVSLLRKSEVIVRCRCAGA